MTPEHLRLSGWGAAFVVTSLTCIWYLPEIIRSLIRWQLKLRDWLQGIHDKAARELEEAEKKEKLDQNKQ